MVTDVTNCPICGSSDIAYMDELETWICDNCSGVFNSNHLPLDFKEIQKAQELEQSEVNKSRAWSEQIAPKDNSEANLIRFLETVEELVQELDLTPEIEIRTAEVVTEAWKTNFFHGRTAETVIAASLYISTRECHYAVPPGRIADLIQQEKSTLKRTYMQLKSELSIKLGPTDPTEFVPYLCGSLQLSNKVEEHALNLLAYNDLPGGNPIGIAAGAVFIVGNKESHRPTQRELARVTHLTKETIYRKSSELSQKGQYQT